MIETRRKSIKEAVEQREKFMKEQLMRQYRIDDEEDERLKQLEERNQKNRIGVIGEIK